LLVSNCILKQYVFILMVSVTDMGRLLVYGPAELADRPTVYVRWQGQDICFALFCFVLPSATVIVAQITCS
jgi:hypothetical protein